MMQKCWCTLDQQPLNNKEWSFPSMEKFQDVFWQHVFIQTEGVRIRWDSEHTILLLNEGFFLLGYETVGRNVLRNCPWFTFPRSSSGEKQLFLHGCFRIFGGNFFSLRDKFCEAFQEVAAKICINIHVLFQVLYSSKCLNSTGNSFSNYVMEIVALDMPPLPIIAILA